MRILSQTPNAISCRKRNLIRKAQIESDPIYLAQKKMEQEKKRILLKKQKEETQKKNAQEYAARQKEKLLSSEWARIASNGNIKRRDEEAIFAEECGKLIDADAINLSGKDRPRNATAVFDDRIFMAAPALRKLAKKESDDSMAEMKWKKVCNWMLLDMILTLKLHPAEISDMKTVDIVLDESPAYLTISRHIMYGNRKTMRINISEDLLNHVKEYLAYRSKLIERKFQGYNNSGYIHPVDGEYFIPGPHGILSPKSVTRIIIKLCHRLKLLDWKNRTDTSKPKAYIRHWDPKNPMATSNGQVMEHRSIMAQKIGRALFPFEFVHHKNNDPTDNRPENLEIRVTFGKLLEKHLKNNPEERELINMISADSRSHPPGLSLGEFEHALISYGRLHFPHLLIPKLRDVSCKKDGEGKNQRTEQLYLFPEYDTPLRAG